MILDVTPVAKRPGSADPTPKCVEAQPPSAHSTRKEKPMRKIILVIASLSIVLILGGVRPATAQFYTQHNLVSDGAVPADHLDPNMVNAWGLAASPSSPWWISNNGTGTTTLYRVNTGAISFFTVPGAIGKSSPTGLVRNNGTGVIVSNGGVGSPSPATFILASEDGTISGFRGNPLVIAVNNSASGAIYKGLAIATGTATGDFLYATNFHAGTVDVFNSTFAQVNGTLPPGAFTDPDLPPSYAPFGIQNLNGVIYVTYALQDALKHDDVPGKGHGFVNAFDPGAQRDNGEYQQRGRLHSVDGRPLVIDGLWGLAFGSGSPASGPRNTLFFTAGPSDEQHGLFGSLVEAPSP